MTGSRILGLAVIGFCVATAAAAQTPTLLRPNLERFEPVARGQLEDLYAEATRHNNGTKAEEADTYGLLGETYLAYELPEEAESALSLAARLDPAQPRWPYLRALAALGRGDREAALGHFDTVLTQRPDQLPSLLHSAEILLDLGRLDAAATRYAEAQTILADQDLPGMRAAIHFGLGRLAAEVGRHDEAAAEFRSALASQPGATGVYYHLARALHRVGESQAARDALAGRGDVLPVYRDPWYAAMKRRSQGSQADLLLGLKELKAGRLAEAETALLRVIAQRPEDAEVLAGLGRVHQVRQEPIEAEAFYRRALAAERAAGDDETLTVLLNFGALLAQRGDAEALEIFRRAAEADPNSAAAHYNLALEWLRRGNTDAGEQALRRALRIHPNDRAALETLARTLASHGDFTGAVQPYRRLVTQEPERAEFAFGLALTLTLDGRCGEARPVLEEASARFGIETPEGPPLLGLLARVLAACPDDEARDGARALELAQALFQLSPGVESVRTLAMALAEAGRPGDAAEQIQRTLEAAERAGALPQLPVLRRELEIYRAGGTVRSPWQL